MPSPQSDNFRNRDLIEKDVKQTTGTAGTGCNLILTGGNYVHVKTDRRNTANAYAKCYTPAANMRG